MNNSALGTLLSVLLLLTAPLISAGPLREKLQEWRAERQAPHAQIQRDLAYGSDKQQRLDLYLPTNAQQAPMLLMVHGGAWRIGDKGGVNVGRIFTDPRAVDVAGWFQGWAALPYLETGPLVTPDSLAAFDTLMSGQTMLFALYLNFSTEMNIAILKIKAEASLRINTSSLDYTTLQGEVIEGGTMFDLELVGKIDLFLFDGADGVFLIITQLEIGEPFLL